MAWVKSEYAAELAVLSAWIAALVPWSVTVHPGGPLGSWLFFIRFPIAELQVRAASQITVDGEEAPVAELLADVYPGWQVYGNAFVADPVSSAMTYGIDALQAGSVAWAVGAVLVVCAVLLGLAMYADEEGTARRLPVDEVRVMGALLGAATLSFAVATVLYYQGRDVVGVPVPVGVLVVGALAAILLRVDRV